MPVHLSYLVREGGRRPLRLPLRLSSEVAVRVPVAVALRPYAHRILCVPLHCFKYPLTLAIYIPRVQLLHPIPHSRCSTGADAWRWSAWWVPAGQQGWLPYNTVAPDARGPLLIQL